MVIKLIQKLPSDLKFSATFDNLFTSLNLLKIAKNGIGGTGKFVLTNFLSRIAKKATEPTTSDTILPIKSLLSDGMTIAL